MYVREFTSDARAREKPCVRCGLSLRKHLDERHCPQCGLSVWMTLNGNDALDYSKPDWLRQAARGMAVMAAIQVLAYAAYFLAIAGMAAPLFPESRHAHRTPGRSADVARVTENRLIDRDGDTAEAVPGDRWIDADDSSDAPAEPFSAATTLALVVGGVYFVLEAGGLVLMTVHEQRFPDRARTIRRAARVATVAALGTGLAMLGIAVRDQAHPGAMGPLTMWVFGWVIELVFAGCAAASWFWLRPIARRAGKSSLAKLCGYLLFLPVIPFLKAAPFLGLWVFYLVSPLLNLLPIVYIPVSIYLFARCAWLLRQAVPHAEAAWAAETQAPAAIPVAAPVV